MAQFVEWYSLLRYRQQQTGTVCGDIDSREARFVETLTADGHGLALLLSEVASNLAGNPVQLSLASRQIHLWLYLRFYWFQTWTPTFGTALFIITSDVGISSDLNF
jgi:hypothetical protein